MFNFLWIKNIGQLYILGTVKKKEKDASAATFNGETPHQYSSHHKYLLGIIIIIIISLVYIEKNFVCKRAIIRLRLSAASYWD